MWALPFPEKLTSFCNSEVVEEPPEIAIEADEHFIEGDIPEVPLLSDFCQELESLAIDTKSRIQQPPDPVSENSYVELVEHPSNEGAEGSVPQVGPPVASVIDTVREVDTKVAYYPSVSQTFEHDASVPQFSELDVSNYHGVNVYPNLEASAPGFHSLDGSAPPIEASAPLYVEEGASAPPMFEESCQVQIIDDVTKHDSEVCHLAIQPFTESQVSLINN